MFRKDDAAKPPMHLLPAAAVRQVALVMGHGAERYGAFNWTACREPQRYVAAAMRHIVDQMELWQRGGEAWHMELDDDSLLPSLAHAAASLLIALDVMTRLQEENGPAAMEGEQGRAVGSDDMLTS